MQRTGSRLRIGLVLGASTLVLSGCINTGGLDWDLRAGGGDTSTAARQATAAAPQPDSNGIISYPDYQLATARRGETVATMAGRLGMNAEELAQSQCASSDRPAARRRAPLLPNRVSATPQPATVGGLAAASTDHLCHRHHGAGRGWTVRHLARRIKARSRASP